jgi:hypothetical protein
MAKKLNIMPGELVAGETVSATATLTDYPVASGWAVSYRFATPAPITQACTGGTAGAWAIALSSAQTLTIPSGRIRFDALATQTVGQTVAQVVAVDSGVIVVTASPVVVSKWSSVLESVEAAIASWGTSDQRSMSIEGMSVSYRSIDELLKLRAFCTQQIRRENGNKRPNILRARFTI